MNALWLLMAFAAIVPVWWLVRIYRRRSREMDADPDWPATPPMPCSDSRDEGHRPILWINTAELAAILRDSDDVLVVELREHAARLLPIPSSRVLRIAPNEIKEVLEWLPPAQSAAFCGVSGLVAFMIETSPSLQGSASLYLLREDSERREAA